MRYVMMTVVMAGVLMTGGSCNNGPKDMDCVDDQNQPAVCPSEWSNTMDVKGAIAALARNVRITDEGDRVALAEFLGRDADAPDPFGPLIEDENDGNDGNDGNTTNSDKTPNLTNKSTAAKTPQAPK